MEGSNTPCESICESGEKTNESSGSESVNEKGGTDQVVTTLAIEPVGAPDGGYGWVVVMYYPYVSGIDFS